MSTLPPLSAPSISAAGGALAPLPVPFATSLTFKGNRAMPRQQVIGALAFTVDATNAASGAVTYASLVADGVHAPTFTGLREHGSSSGYNNTAGTVNRLSFWFDGLDYMFAVHQDLSEGAVPRLSSAVSAPGDTTVSLTYNLSLDTAFVPAAGAFSLSNSAGADVVSAVAVAGTQVTLTKSRTTQDSDIITASYTPPAINPLQNAAGKAGGFTAYAVSDTAPSAPTLPKWTAALAAYAAGSQSPRVVFIGDSTTAGKGATGDQALNNAFSNNFTSQLGALLTMAGYHVNTANRWGTNNEPNLSAYDNRISTTGGTTQSVAAGFPMYVMSTGDTLTFTPGNHNDTFRIWYPTNNTGLGAFDISVNGGATLQSVDENAGGAGLSSTAVTVTPGMNYVTLTCTSGSGSCYIFAIETRLSSQPEILIDNWGWDSAYAGNFENDKSDPFAAFSALGHIAPDLTVINLTINDCNANTDQTTYQSQLQAIITQAALSGDVILQIGCNSDTATYAPQTRQDQFAAIVNSLAASNGLIVSNTPVLFGGAYSVASANGYMSDQVHPSGTGYGLIAADLKTKMGL